MWKWRQQEETAPRTHVAGSAKKPQTWGEISRGARREEESGLTPGAPPWEEAPRLAACSRDGTESCETVWDHSEESPQTGKRSEDHECPDEGEGAELE